MTADGAVKNQCSPTARPTARNPRSTARFADVLTAFPQALTSTQKIRRAMQLKLTSQTRSAARSSQTAPARCPPAPRPKPSLRGSCSSPTGGRALARATDLELGLHRRARGRGRGRRLGPAARPAARRGRPLARRRRGRDRAARGRARRRDPQRRPSFHLRVLAGRGLPAPSRAQEGEPLTIPAAALAETVELVARAASRDDMRPVLTGVLVSASGSR